MRALFRPFALHAAYTPIETIVFFCIIGTLAYFHILSAIKHSTFLDPSSNYNRLTWRPAHALFQSGEWVAVREGKWGYGLKNAGRTGQQLVEIQQLVLGAEDGLKSADDPTSPGALSSSMLNLTDHLTSSTYRTVAGHSYPELCYRTPSLSSITNYSEKLKAECFTMQQASSRGLIQTLAFKAGKRDEYTKSLLSVEQHGSSHKQPRTFQDENGVQFIVIPEGGLAAVGEVGGFWFAYAARALVVRFWDLAKKADSLDILLILAGYILMHTTFYLLLVRSRQLGSSFWLPLAIMSAAVLSLLLALPIAMAIKIPIDPVALTEALPFLVCTVGFDKPLRLARAVFMHPHLSTPVRPGTGSGYPTGATDGAAISSANGTNASALLAPTQTPTSSAAGQMKPAPKIITESLTHVYPPIIRDYILEIAVLTVGAYSKVGGLAEVCALAALVLAVDCLLLCTYLAAILGIMIEVRRIKTVRAYTRSRSNSVTSSVKSASTNNGSRLQSVMARPTVADLTPRSSTFSERMKTVVLGVKGSGLPEFERGYGGRGQKIVRTKGKKGSKAGNENPVARLKLLLIATFMTLHTLNLITPLTPSKHTYSSAASALGVGIDGQVNVRKVDITAPAVRSVLVALQLQDDHDLVDGEEPSSILVKVHPPIHIRAFSAKSASKAHASLLSSPFAPTPAFMHAQGLIAQHKRSTSEHVDAFMSAWTRLVGDPILSKWIVILLVISVVLNGYLLKGIAAGVVGAGVGTFKAFSVRGAVRFEEEDEAAVPSTSPAPVAVQPKEKTDEVKSEAASVTPKAAAFVVPAAPVPSAAAPAIVQAPPATVGTFTLEDVDRRLEQARANSRRMTVTASSASTSTTATSISSSSITSDVGSSASSATSASAETRSLSEVLDIFEHGPRPLSASLALLTDEEVIMLVQEGRIQPYALEKALGMDLPNLERAVRVRRAVISRASRTKTLEHSDIPLTQYDYSRVYGACCENVVGYIPLPLGIAGPLNIDGQSYLIPMATAEGTLVASTSRGCKALNAGGGVSTVLLRDAMTRGPAVQFDTIQEAARCARWIESVEGSETLRRAFESTSRFAKLVGGSASGIDGSNNGGGLKTALAGRTLYIRFRTTTGDAMGMNMISKGTEKALAALQEEFPTARVLALSGNYCTDKKAAAINWIEGRGKSVVAECVVPGAVVEKVLKTTVRGIVDLNIKKNLIGSAMASVVGGYNAHAANIVAAVFLATGQDPAQVVESSMCLTGMEAVNNDRDLLITVTMPSIEVGTVGGGTVLAPQGGVLSLLGIKGAHPTHPGQNAQQLARIVASAVMAGELSLMSALAAGDLIRAHMTHNRSVANTPAAGAVPAGEGHGVLVDSGASAKVLPLTPTSSTPLTPA